MARWPQKGRIQHQQSPSTWALANLRRQFFLDRDLWKMFGTTLTVISLSDFAMETFSSANAASLGTGSPFRQNEMNV